MHRALPNPRLPQRSHPQLYHPDFHAGLLVLESFRSHCDAVVLSERHGAEVHGFEGAAAGFEIPKRGAFDDVEAWRGGAGGAEEDGDAVGGRSRRRG